MGRLADVLSDAGFHGESGQVARDEAVLPAAIALSCRGRSASGLASSFLGNVDQPPAQDDDDRPGEMSFSIPYSGEWKTMHDIYNTAPTMARKSQEWMSFGAGVAVGGLGTYIPAYLYLLFTEGLSDQRSEFVVMYADPATSAGAPVQAQPVVAQSGAAAAAAR
uniref:Uncharacterized protein n=1 Tax=Alexandrium andersonii TaxID=327968 RepID=A0A7S2HHY1_9DINO|mmetsp:Transcript_71378/g.159816  ORF Transcript_71378/g.159816 Transcript_71378/m.159816 type:complete len:164 (+) Transcript_71378:130-621(+)